ncbi:MAG TPA: DUF2062 domain-containing protein [Acidobacteriota bacterium]|nr:DUF2062 domain-containing protein [Acidobacteriota bacterium]
MRTRILRKLASIRGSPEEIAHAFSVGVFLGFSPFIGLQTVLGLLAAYQFRFNKIPVLLGVWVNLPWIMAPYYAVATTAGIRLLGLPESGPAPSLGYSDLFNPEFWKWLGSQWPMLVPTVVGSLIFAAIFAAVSYPLCLRLVQRMRRPKTQDSTGC